jgi:hypothetical protein
MIRCDKHGVRWFGKECKKCAIEEKSRRRTLDVKEYLKSNGCVETVSLMDFMKTQKKGE